MKHIAMVVMVAGTLMAAGYRVPENSVNSTALSAAYVANAGGADAAYFNPANMAFGDDKQQLELDVSSITLSKMTFQGSAPTAGSGVIDNSGGVSEAEHFIVPALHYVSPAFGSWRLGIAIVVPAGLTKRWETQPARGYARHFTLQTVEVNPTFAYRLNAALSMGGGVRLIYTSGVVQSASAASRDMSGSGIEFGYNLAVAYRPSPALRFAATYRSNVALHVSGSAKLYFPDDGAYNGPVYYDGDTKVSVPIPAVLQLAAAYTFNASGDYPTTLETVAERSFWSSYVELDFDYESSIGPLTPSFDAPVDKHWEDSDTFRIGVTQALKAWTLLAGFAYDTNPVPEKSLSFELPDSDAYIFSGGVRYRIDTAWDVGLGLLYDIKKTRTVRGENNDMGIDGTFSDASALLVTAGIALRF